MTTVHWTRPRRYRSIFISDTHLGFRGARADFLLDFLRSTESTYLYLVGDIVDVWEMQRKRLYWPAAHNEVLKEIMAKAASGTQVIYIPGNHDELLRQYDGTVIQEVRVHRETIHETADGRRLLVLHGDQFDTVVQCSPLLAMVGNRAYDWLLRANHWVNWLRRALGFPYWSLAQYLKHRVKNAVQYISRFEEAVALEARRRGVDGLVCGHIHRAEITDIDGVLYTNCGDWVESCTALTEAADGSLNLVQWTDQARHTVKSWEGDALGEKAA